MAEIRTLLIDDARSALLALSPLRRRILELLREPGSAAGVAQALGMPRQKVGYHLRALEAAGLVGLSAERARRGFTERLLIAKADAFILDPGMMGGPPPDGDVLDRYAAAHLIAAATATIRDVTRMRSAAAAAGKRLLTFTIEADLSFALPADVEVFTSRLAEAVAQLVTDIGSAERGQHYRLVVGGHPARADAPSRQTN